MTLRVLIADDHPAFREGLALMLGATDDIDVVGQAATGSDAVKLAGELAPDVVVMDIRMPDGNGIDATRRLLRAAPGTGVAVLTMFEDDDSVFAAMRAGARGYLLKDAGRDETLASIRAIGRRAGDLQPGHRAPPDRLLHGDRRERRPAIPELTAREREVLELIARGLGNAAIAQQLGLSLKTVRNNVSNISTSCRSPTGPPRSSRRRGGLGR